MRRQAQSQLCFRSVGLGRTLEPAHGFFQHFEVKIKANAAHVARLHFAQDVARAAQAQVFHGHLKTGAEVVHVEDHPQAFASKFRRFFEIGHDEIGIRLPGRTPHPAAQLIELAQAEHVGIVHDQGIGPRKIQAGFDDGRAHQNVGLAVPKAVHGLFQGGLGHLAVGHGHLGLGGEFLHEPGHILQALHPVVDPEYLSLAVELTSEHLA